ncbi:MAG: hypothetical protein MJB14_10075, partial [Spirochaetes bacterium]|nr:hypothetical protein [Spirochaetota bacterium]
GKMTITIPNLFDSTIAEAAFYLLPVTAGGNLTIEKIKQNNSNLKFQKSNDICYVQLANPLKPQDDTTLTLIFQGQLPPKCNGPGVFFADSESVSLGGFYPALVPFKPNGEINAVTPTKYGDPPGIDLATYIVQLTAPKGYLFASTGNLKKLHDNEHEVAYQILSGPVREFFIAGSTNWEEVSSKHKGITITSYYPNGNLKQGINAIYFSKDSLDIFSEAYCPYPYSEFDIISAPMGNHGVGMEYPGIIVLNDRLYSPNGMAFGYAADFRMEITTAHEVAHQWFYNLVGNEPVTEPWIDEALAQYSTWLYFSEKNSEASADPLFSSFMNRWKRIKKKLVPIGLPVDSYGPREYGAIVYGRAPLFYFLFRQLNGEEKFNLYLKDYVQQYAWKTVKSEDIQNLLVKHYGPKSKKDFSYWILGKDISEE